jgi:ABC-type anion transport system duplicated permease subunit
MFCFCACQLGANRGFLVSLVVSAAYSFAVIVPVARIFKRLGINPWISILSAVPLVNFFGLWLFAFSPWPSDSAAAEQEAE